MADNRHASQRITDDIKEQIKLGIYEKNAPLPSENEISAKYGVSRVTVQKALNVLSAGNYIYSVPGKGNFIKESFGKEYLLKYDEFKSFDVKLLGVDIIAPTPDVIYNLQVPPAKRVVRVRRLAMKFNDNVAYDVKYIPYYSGIPLVEAEINYSLFPDLVSNLASAYEIKRELHIKGIFADDEVCEALNVLRRTPLVEVEQRLVDDEDACIGWGKVFYRTEYFSMDAEKITV